MKIAFLISAMLGLSAVVSSHWEAILLNFSHQYVVSLDCRRQDWKLIDYNEPLPASNQNVCYMKEQVPKNPIEGNKIAFAGKLSTHAEMNIGISYMFEIVDATRYMKAFSNNSMQNTALISTLPSSSVWESAKWLFVDKVILDIASSPGVLQVNWAEDFSLEKLDSRIMSQANVRLSTLGIRLTTVMSS